MLSLLVMVAAVAAVTVLVSAVVGFGFHLGWALAA
jgi:hypothetical protein